MIFSMILLNVGRREMFSFLKTCAISDIFLMSKIGRNKAIVNERFNLIRKRMSES